MQQIGSMAGNRLDGFAFTYENTLSSGLSALTFDSQSLTSSVTDVVHENGRTYHAWHADSYHFPNDEAEAERLDLQYEVLKQVLDGKSHLAPLSKKRPPRRILDIGTGTGIWCIDMGDAFPGATVLGTDLSPTLMPRVSSPNVSFLVDDLAMDWLPEYKGSDYIHTRITLGCWQDMKRDIIQRAFDNLAPGGYLECQEIDPLLRCDDKTMRKSFAPRKFFKLLVETSHEAERPLDIAEHLAGWLRDVGFVDVHEEVFQIPISGWPKESKRRDIGRAHQENLLSGLSAFSLGLLTRFRGMSEEEVQLLLVDVRRQLRDESVHAYMNFHVVWGRKPKASSHRGK